MLVTPDGDVVVLGYFINAETVTFQPRLFIARSTGTSPQGLSNFEEIPLGLGATVYLGGANGSPRMRLAPEVIDGKVRIFAVRQFTTLQSEIVMIEVDLEAPPGLAGRGNAGLASCGHHRPGSHCSPRSRGPGAQPLH